MRRYMGAKTSSIEVRKRLHQRGPDAHHRYSTPSSVSRGTPGTNGRLWLTSLYSMPAGRRPFELVFGALSVIDMAAVFDAARALYQHGQSNVDASRSFGPHPQQAEVVVSRSSRIYRHSHSAQDGRCFTWNIQDIDHAAGQQLCST